GGLVSPQPARLLDGFPAHAADLRGEPPARLPDDAPHPGAGTLTPGGRRRFRAGVRDQPEVHGLLGRDLHGVAHLLDLELVRPAHSVPSFMISPSRSIARHAPGSRSSRSTTGTPNSAAMGEGGGMGASTGRH